MEEQAIIPMSEYKRLKRVDENQDKIKLCTETGPWGGIMHCDYIGKDEAVLILSRKLDTALKLIDKIEESGLWGRVFFAGFKKEYKG